MAQAASKKSKAKSKTKNRVSVKQKSKMPKRKTAKKAKKAPAKAKKKTKAKATKKPAKRIAKKTSAKVIRLKALPALSTEAAVAQPHRVAVGDLAPNFTLNDHNGTPVTLASFAGKKVVLYFYPKDDTPGCTKESCSFRDNLPSFDGADAAILGVSFDDQESHQKFIQKYQLNFQLLSDLNKEVANAYGVYVDKNMYGNITKGIERSTFVIDRSGRIAAAWRKVSVDGHTQEVLDALAKIE